MKGSMESAVITRYAKGARAVEADLCCPVSYDPALLAMLPAEIVEKDYGCGDPSRYVRPGDVVLDLGSGSGKICYMAAHLVGSAGRVIGVDFNDAMLSLARKYQGEMAQKLGGDRVRFHKGRIQDLALDLDQVAGYLKDHPVTDLATADAFTAWQGQIRAEAPMIPDKSVDLVISNCVLNLVEEGLKRQLVQEIYRVLKPGGRVAISDIVSDQPVPVALQADAQLWSGCISGAFYEADFVAAFRRAGFVGVTFDKWDEAPWRVVSGIEFRSVTLTAVKQPLCCERDEGHAVIYRGPFAEVQDEDGFRFLTGQRMAVSRQRFERLAGTPFADHFIFLLPGQGFETRPFALPPGSQRAPESTRGGGSRAPSSCQTTGCC